MTAENLTATRSADTLAITSPAPTADLPTVVLALGPTLTAEITPGSKLPVRLATEDYTRDKKRIETLLGTETTSRIDATGDGTYTLTFTPAPAWYTALDLATQQWNLNWNPLPLDPELLALDLLRAQNEAIPLTGTLPDQHLAATAYPAAQTLQRLLDADAITPEARPLVTKAIDASHANTPLNHTDTTPYTLPVPLTTAEIRTILDPAPPTPGAIATGSPDWRLTGHGPAATAENTITVLPHKTVPTAITITTPAKPHTHPENTPAYQALITDPDTGNTIATTTLHYHPATNTYTGHTTPRRPITNTDLLDIRHPRNPAPPITTTQERLASHQHREAIRAFVGSPRVFVGTAELAGTGKLLADLPSSLQHDHRPDVDLWLEFESVALTGTRSAATAASPGKTIKLSAAIDHLGATAMVIGAEGKPWILRITAVQPLGRIRVGIRWNSGAETSLLVDHSPMSPSVMLQPPHNDDTPRSILVVRAEDG